MINKEFLKEFHEIVENMKVKKSKYNKFGQFYYRSCEDIMNAFREVAKDKDLLLLLEDEIVNLGTRYYVKATAIVTNGSDTISNTAYAREAEAKSGMDAAQITGAASSYARKYAMNGLFCLDDAQDLDEPSNKIIDEKTIKKYKEDLAKITSREQLDQYWYDHPEYQKDANFLAEIKKIGEKYPKA